MEEEDKASTTTGEIARRAGGPMDRTEGSGGSFTGAASVKRGDGGRQTGDF